MEQAFLEVCSIFCKYCQECAANDVTFASALRLLM